jgi:hypothetical protein
VCAFVRADDAVELYVSRSRRYGTQRRSLV